MATIPTWKKERIKVGTGSASYRIEFNGENIFQGVAVNRPDETDTFTILNDLYPMAFTDMGFPAIVGTTGYKEYNGGIIPKFKVVGQSVNTDIYPVYDWTYEESEYLSGRDLTRPLRTDGVGELDCRQVATFSFYGTTKKNVNMTYGGSRAIAGGKYGTAYADLRKYGKYDILKFTGYKTHTYKVVQSCCRYCLHYLNKAGGWDSILMNGRNTSSEDYGRKGIITGIQDTEGIYYTNVVKKWQLSRVLMVGGEGLRTTEVAGSPMLVLEDLEADGSGRFTSVNVDSNNCVERDYASNGNQFVQFDLVVRGAVQRRR